MLRMQLRAPFEVAFCMQFEVKWNFVLEQCLWISSQKRATTPEVCMLERSDRFSMLYGIAIAAL